MAKTFESPDVARSPDAPFTGRILLDTPAVQPVLGFTQIADALARIIQESEPRFAVGIFGGWGCGKSTLMEAIAKQIDQKKAIVVQFNAWRYEREPHLILPLLDTIRACLWSWAAASENPTEVVDQVRSIAGRIGKVVRALAGGFTAAVGVPGAVTLTFDAGKALEALSPQGAGDAGAPQSLYYAAFQELNSAFQEVESAAFDRIVVFVDDLDRSLPASALTVLESMKLFFDMRGFVFVVGMDEEVIVRAVSSKFAHEVPSNGGIATDVQLDREYVKKIFQVPYTLPPMAPEDLDELLQHWVRAGDVDDAQRRDLEGRVRRYLPHVMQEGYINPREVKRFVNAYTLQRMIRPDLDADTVLALQTLEFRRDWEDVYDVLLAEPNDFVNALRHYRDGDVHAFQNLWPTLPVLSADLVGYLRSHEAAPLTSGDDLERYLSSLKSARTVQPWLSDAIRDIGQLRKVVRRLPADLDFGSPGTKEAAQELQRVLSRLDRYKGLAESDNSPRSRLQQLSRRLGNEPESPGASSEPAATTREQMEEWKAEAYRAIDDLHEQVRIVRRSSAFAPT